jgi:putative transposase
MIYRQVPELAADGFPVAVICRRLGISRSGYYDWRSRRPLARPAADEKLMDTIAEIHVMSRVTPTPPLDDEPGSATRRSGAYRGFMHTEP